VAEDMLRLAVERLPDQAFVTLDRKGLITSWNSGAEHLLGHRREHTVGQHLSAIFGGDGGGGIGMEDLEEAERQGLVSGSRWLTHEDGSARRAKTTVMAIQDDAGLVGYAVVAYEQSLLTTLRSDVSDGRAREADLEQTRRQLSEPKALPAAERADRMRLQELQRAVGARDEFIATVAHELRNPISPLMFQVRLAINKTEQMASAGTPVSIEWVQSQLRGVEQRLHRLLETLDRLLDVSRLSTGRIDLQPEPLNLADVVRDVVGTLEAELAVARCKLALSEQGETTGSWDRLRVEQICRNLLSNAIRFGAGGPIEVSVAGDHDFATLRVRDHGIGIAPDQQSRIFERFERGGEQRSGGFGIGLWIVRNICVAMGGTVSVESEPGSGARFTVMLPRRAPREPIIAGSE